jgi:uncharacterized RDD family membrane protein YckC
MLVTGRVPSLRRRMACLVYEGMLLFGIVLVSGAAGALLYAATGQAHDALLRGLTFGLYGFYFVWFWSRKGQTLAMQTWQIRVVTKSGQTPSPKRALLRYLTGCAWVAPAGLLVWANGWTGKQALAAFGVGVPAYALLALLQPERQFWHDVICGTRLVAAAPRA